MKLIAFAPAAAASAVAFALVMPSAVQRPAALTAESSPAAGRSEPTGRAGAENVDKLLDAYDEAYNDLDLIR